MLARPSALQGLPSVKGALDLSSLRSFATVSLGNTDDFEVSTTQLSALAVPVPAGIDPQPLFILCCKYEHKKNKCPKNKI